MILLGLDIGSSSIKGALVDSKTKEPLAITQSPKKEMPIKAEQKGWAEQDPETWWYHVKEVIQELSTSSKIPLEKIESIGISYQMHGLVLVDKNQKVLRPSIIWCDSRAVSIGEKSFTEIGEQKCLKTMLNSPGNFTASKLKWVKDNEPGVFEKIDKVLLPGDFIAMKLTGQINTTISGMSEGVFWDFKNHHISEDLLKNYNFRKELFPSLVPTIAKQGTVSKNVSDTLGLKIGTPIGYRAGDQPNNALSLNVFEPGEVAATGGTSGVIYGVSDRLITDSTQRCNVFAHVNHTRDIPRLGQLICINGSGILYNWLKNILTKNDESYASIEYKIQNIPVGSDGLSVLPFGNGAERVLNNQNMGAHMLNIDFNRHSQDHIYRAGLEGIANSFVYGIEILNQLGTEVKTLKVGNDNLFQSEVFAKTIATILDVQIEMYENTGAIGAACASGIPIGAFKSYQEAFQLGDPIKVYTSDEKNKAAYVDQYKSWSANLAKLK